MKLGSLFEGADRAAVDQKLSDLLTAKKIAVTVRVRRTYTILLLFTLLVSFQKQLWTVTLHTLTHTSAC